MANTIRLKRASGSDPGASDLVTGELAVRTDNGKLFTKKDDNSVTEIGVTTLGDNDVTTAKIADDAVTLAKMQNVITDSILGRTTSGTGIIEILSASSVRGIINVEDGATADQSASEIVALVADQTIAPSTIDMEDNEKILLGSGDDLEFYHDSNNSVIANNTGSTFIKGLGGSGNTIILEPKNNENSAKFIPDGAVELYHNNSKKFETSSSGGTLTGTLVADGFTGPLTGNVTGNASGSSGSCTGNAATATVLANARTIAGVSFDGSANISLNNNAITNGAGYLTSVGTSDIDNDAVTFAKLENVENNRILGRVSSGAGNAEELTQSQVRTLLGLATSATTDTTNASNISSGTLAAARVATLNQDTSGNAATATKLATARTIAGVSFDGSANISLNNNAITNGAGYITSADGGNAATLDSIDSSQFLRSDANDSASGILTLTAGLSFGADARCAASVSSLSDGSTITVDFTSGIHHSVTLGGNRTFGNPSNDGSTVGQSGSIFITQDGTGSRTASFHSDYKFAGGTAPTLSTAANAVDRIDYVIKASGVIHCAVSLDVK